MSESPNTERRIKCPQCGRLTVYSLENQWRPFCSQRCRLIDLGQWADESYRIPLKPTAEAEDDEGSSIRDPDEESI